MSDTDNKAIISEFNELVNMTAAALKKWLTTEESKKVGYKTDDSKESVGHEMGGHIVEILHKKKSDYSDEDIKHMHKVVGYIRRHSAQRPKGDISDTPWRYSLMNWGHDPEKE